jgi:hypothetical protein
VVQTSGAGQYFAEEFVPLAEKPLMDYLPNSLRNTRSGISIALLVVFSLLSLSCVCLICGTVTIGKKVLSIQEAVETPLPQAVDEAPVKPPKAHTRRELPQLLQDLLFLGTVAYFIFIIVRATPLLLGILPGDSTERSLILVIAILFGCGVLITGLGGPMKDTAQMLFLTGVLVFSLMTFVVTSRQAVSSIKYQLLAGIPFFLLIGVELTVNFIEPLLGYPLCIILLGVNAFRNYRDLESMHYDYLPASLNYIFGWPPMLLLFTLVDLILISYIFPPLILNLVILMFTGLGLFLGLLD